MFVKEFKEDKWVFLNGNINFDELYGEEYEQRVGNNYYNPTVIEARENFIKKFTSPELVFDYGCGRKPVFENEKSSNYDPYIDKFKNFDREKFLLADTIAFFDVLEHFFDLRTVLTILPHNKIIGTIPIVPNNHLKDIDQLFNWKHWKPGEHYFLFTENGFKEFFKECGWEVTYFEMDECPPRQDIYSFYCERK